MLKPLHKIPQPHSALPSPSPPPPPPSPSSQHHNYSLSDYEHMERAWIANLRSYACSLVVDLFDRLYRKERKRCEIQNDFSLGVDNSFIANCLKKIHDDNYLSSEEFLWPWMKNNIVDKNTIPTFDNAIDSLFTNTQYNDDYEHWARTRIRKLLLYDFSENYIAYKLDINVGSITEALKRFIQNYATKLIMSNVSSSLYFTIEDERRASFMERRREHLLHIAHEAFDTTFDNLISLHDVINQAKLIKDQQANFFSENENENENDDIQSQSSSRSSHSYSSSSSASSSSASRSQSQSSHSEEYEYSDRGGGNNDDDDDDEEEDEREINTSDVGHNDDNDEQSYSANENDDDIGDDDDDNRWDLDKNGGDQYDDDVDDDDDNGGAANDHREPRRHHSGHSHRRHHHGHRRPHHSSHSRRHSRR